MKNRLVLKQSSLFKRRGVAGKRGKKLPGIYIKHNVCKSVLPCLAPNLTTEQMQYTPLLTPA